MVTTIPAADEKFYSSDEALAASRAYFGDDLGAVIAASAAVNKYLLRKEENGESFYRELTPDDMHDRLAHEFTRKELNFLDISNEEVAQMRAERNTAYWENFYKPIRKYLHRFGMIVPQGSPMFGIGNRYTYISLSNCVVIASPHDSWTGIAVTGRDLGNLMKRRCGVGIDISTLRPEGTKVHNAAITTTGGWSFADFFSYITEKIGQNGRRGALMITKRVWHPDVWNFIMMKADLGKVTGANVSVMITDAFMEAVDADADWDLVFPDTTDPDYDTLWDGDLEAWKARDKTPIVHRTLPARELWDHICKYAHGFAEPGLIFEDNYKRNLPAHGYEMFRLVSVNPCSEIGLSPYDSCRLITMNLMGFVINPYTDNAYFDWEKFSEAVWWGMRLSDDLVELEIEAIDRIIEKTAKDDQERALWKKLQDAGRNGRRTGLGMHALGDALAACGVRYDSEDGIAVADKIAEVFKLAAYSASVDLAQERGPFPVFDWQIHRKSEFIQRLPDALQNRIAQHGIRNVSCLTMAPTGTVSTVCETTGGIEPIFAPCYIRRKRVVTHDVDARVDFVDDQGKQWMNFVMFHKGIQRWLEINRPDVWAQIAPLVDNATNFDKIMAVITPVLPEQFVWADTIDWEKRVAFQGAVQQHIDHGISSTINLPADVDVPTVQRLYELAHKHGLKGVTIYRDGCRSGVLLRQADKKEGEINYNDAPDRPDSLPCNVHLTSVEGKKWVVFVGLLGDKPYEVFAGKLENIELPLPLRVASNTLGAAQIVREKVSNPTKYERTHIYNVVLNEKLVKEGETGVLLDLVHDLDSGMYGTFTRTISLLLRHGVKPQFIAEQIGRDANEGINHFTKVISRVLTKHYVEDGEEGGSNCPTCGDKLVYTDGCTMCPSCGVGKCN